MPLHKQTLNAITYPQRLYLLLNAEYKLPVELYWLDKLPAFASALSEILAARSATFFEKVPDVPSALSRLSVSAAFNLFWSISSVPSLAIEILTGFSGNSTGFQE